MINRSAINSEEMSDYISVKQLLSIVQVSKTKIYDLIKTEFFINGDHYYKPDGGIILFKTSAIKDWIKENKKQRGECFLDTKKNLGISEVQFNEIKDTSFGTVITICTMFDNNKKPYSRGISICSLADTFNRKTAKRISFDRAMLAIEDEKTSGRIRTKEYYKSVRRKICINNQNPETIKDLYLTKIKHVKVINIKGREWLEFTINSFYPLELAKSLGIKYKSEFKPQYSLRFDSENGKYLI